MFVLRNISNNPRDRHAMLISGGSRESSAMSAQLHCKLVRESLLVSDCGHAEKLIPSPQNNQSSSRVWVITDVLLTRIQVCVDTQSLTLSHWLVERASGCSKVPRQRKLDIGLGIEAFHRLPLSHSVSDGIQSTLAAVSLS
jgi:hypothetical protein